MRLISQKHPQWKTPDNDTTNYLNWQCDGNIYWTCDAELTRSIISRQPTIRLFNSRGFASDCQRFFHTENLQMFHHEGAGG